MEEHKDARGDAVKFQRLIEKEHPDVDWEDLMENEIVFQAVMSQAEAEAWENHYMEKYDSIKNGYNQQYAGIGDIQDAVLEDPARHIVKKQLLLFAEMQLERIINRIYWTDEGSESMTRELEIAVNCLKVCQDVIRRADVSDSCHLHLIRKLNGYCETDGLVSREYPFYKLYDKQLVERWRRLAEEREFRKRVAREEAERLREEREEQARRDAALLARQRQLEQEAEEKRVRAERLAARREAWADYKAEWGVPLLLGGIVAVICLVLFFLL